MSLISVCLPVFNGEKFLLHALESIESQTYKDFELLISDDGSSDSSINIIEEFKNSSLLEIRVFKNNGFGIAKNCNFLAQKACGKYLKFLFQDDFIDSDFLAKMLLPFKENSNVSLAFCNRHLKLESDSIECLQIFEGCKDLTAKWSNLKSIQVGFDFFEDPLLLEGPINKVGEPSSSIISEKHFNKVGGFSEDLKQLLDLELWFKLFAVGNVAYVDKKLSTFRIHPQQESFNNFVNKISTGEAIQLYLSLLTDPLYTQISSNSKLRICKKLILAQVGDKIDINVFNRQVLDLRSEIEAKNAEIEAKNAEIEAKNAEIEAKNTEIDSQTTELTKKIQRISFMENTLVWKFRRLYMKFYYLYKRTSSKKASNNEISNFIEFDSFRTLEFTLINNPKFSIIICYYNNFKETHLCLNSILNNTKGIEYEIILVDDFSDSSPKFLSSINNITYLRNNKNYGFLFSSNKGADVAKGKYLVFLNNDTQVEENWLNSCVSLLKKRGTGAVGSKLLYPDGKLQEAGGIIWNDASGCNYGKGDYPKLPEYNFVREVDYCSGASLITPREVFIHLGGFSKEFEPAYYEDTDYCFRLRALGLKVFYQPDSVVYHHEGLSCGTNLNEGVKRYQEKNASIFRKKWNLQLVHHLQNQSTLQGKYKGANNHGDKISVLVIDSYVPRFDRESGSNRLLNIIKILKELDCHVIFFPDNEFGEQPYTNLLCQLGVEVIYKIDESYSTFIELKKRIQLIDFAWICRPQLFNKYYKYLSTNKNLFLIYDTIDLHFQRIKREWELKGSSIKKLEQKWRKSLALEKKCSSKASLTITVTHEEKKVVDGWGAKCNVVPNVHEPSSREVPGFLEREGLLFIGSYLHPPNVDAVIWLCEEIMHEVWKWNPKVNLTLLGSNPSEEILKYKSENVSVPGYIPDVKSYFDRSKIFLSPLRYGAGMKGKIGQSMAFGLPVITTKVGAEGMNLQHNLNSMIVESTKDFVTAIRSLYENEEEWNIISKKSLKHIEKFSPKIVSKEIQKIISKSKNGMHTIR